MHYKGKYTACSQGEPDQDVAGKASGFAVVERQTAEEALDVVDPAEENLGMGANMADCSIVEAHCQNAVVAGVGKLEGILQVAVALACLAFEVLASWEIQTLRDIADLLHLPMHLMALDEGTQATYGHHLEEGDSSGEDAVH